ncbi:coiled-coil domain-containing protein 171-like, partial [Zonotrichia albicollis]|uniref:coiled-coil domain-containing protein 171-like n=1 Tax=Zonotrichia albicollis TaxID=44394 RepID=UPI003D811B79
MSILLNLYQSMANAHVLTKQTTVPLEQLPWTELCALLHENVEALILNFHKANERISHLEHTCKQKTDTMNNLLENQEDAFKKMSEEFKAQEHLWQKEKQCLEEQYSNRLAEIQARAQECEEREQKNRQKLYGLEQMCAQLTQENNSMKNTLSSGHKEGSPLLAACALLSGALCSLYGRLCTMPCQRDILQEQMNQHQLLKEKIISLLYALPTVVERNQDEGRLRQRRAKNLVYVFRRAVIAVLAANRLRALARYSCTFFVWTDGSRGSTGIQVCVGESRGRHPVPRFGEEGVDCMEALQWLTSSNLYTAIISSISELQDVLNSQDAESWLSGHSLIGAARNCFAKLMDNLSVLMETVQRNTCGYRPYLERDSLIQRLARGLQRVNAQALEAGLYDRLPGTRNIAILQQEIFGFLRRLHAAEVESHSLHLQLAECGWAFSEMQKDAEEACRLQEQLNELQHRINQDNIHKELDNALQREHEAKLLLQEHQRRIQELSNTLELHSCANKDRSQVSNVPLMSLSNAAEELRRRDQALDHQNRLLKDTEQYQQRLQETLQEAERAIQEQGAIDEELIINHVKAVEATLNEVREEAVASDAAAAMPLPSLKTLSEEAMRDRPETSSFQ